MAPAARLLLCCAVISLVCTVCLGGGSDGEFPACGVPCCDVEPSCSGAVRVTCDCPDLQQMALKKGDLPTSVQVVSILRTKHVTIHSHAVSGLSSLRNFSLRGIHSVDIEQAGMALQKRSELRSVRIQGIDTLRIKSKAFSGVWENRTSVDLSGIIGLNIESKAFDYTSTSLGPSLMLRNVGMLALASKGFNAPATEMSLENVVVQVCLAESFGGHIQTTEFNNVTIAEAKARCVNGVGDLMNFSMQHSTMKTVHPQAFSGELYELIIKRSNFVTMHNRSLHLRVHNMEMSRSFVEHLSSNGLSVRATGSIRLENIRVELLSKNALAGLQIEPSETGFYAPLIIRQLEIVSAELGSLTFAECTDLQITGLNLATPWPRICPTEKWTRALSEGTVDGPLTRAQYELFFRLYERRLCGVNDKRPIMIPAERPRCAARADDLRVSREGAEYNGDGSTVHSGQEAVVEGKVVGDNIPSREATTVNEVVGFDDEDDSDVAQSTTSLRERRSLPPSVVDQKPMAKNLLSTDEDADSRPADRRGSESPDALPAPSTTAAADQQQATTQRMHRLFLYLSLGVVLSLAGVLAVVLLLMLLGKRRRRRSSSSAKHRAEEPPQAVETLCMVLANQLTQRGDGGELALQLAQRGDGGELALQLAQHADGGEQAACQGQCCEGRCRAADHSSGYNSARQSIDSHQYEPIREALLINLDDSFSTESQMYSHLMDR